LFHCTPRPQALDVALTTVRTHLAHIFDKTGTSRQAELVRLAARLAPPSAPLVSTLAADHLENEIPTAMATAVGIKGVVG
jgi:hypothetical protein